MLDRLLVTLQFIFVILSYNILGEKIVVRFFYYSSAKSCFVSQWVRFRLKLSFSLNHACNLVVDNELARGGLLKMDNFN